ncbi:MAG: glycosyltransferase family 2 protein [Pseudomonadota bacterium]
MDTLHEIEVSETARDTQLSVVVPTFNERENVGEMVRRLEETMGEIPWEVIFVDDASPDGTADVVRTLAREDRRVRLISRHNRRGLASAVVEGALAASADIVAVMDGDLQHDESVLPDMYRRVRQGEADVVSASRFLTEDGADGLSSQTRVAISNNGIRLSNWVFNLEMTDPLTGFFVVRRDVVRRALPDLSELGFKVLMDIIISAEPRPKVAEVPFKFRERVHGESKLDNRVMYEFFLFFIEKKISSILPLPARFLSFAFINSIGILVHLAVLFPMMVVLGEGSFINAQIVATLVAMGFNYTVNNLVTYSDRKLKGPKFYAGFFIFAALCSVGILGNVGVASVLHRDYPSLAVYVPAIAGALITVVWNYVATAAFVWGRLKYPSVLLRRRKAVEA